MLLSYHIKKFEEVIKDIFTTTLLLIYPMLNTH